VVRDIAGDKKGFGAYEERCMIEGRHEEGQPQHMAGVLKVLIDEDEHDDAELTPDGPEKEQHPH
jgi:hypothetical protein